MEKKKLLLVAISVGLFLVIAIGAALVVFAPKTTPSGAVVSRPANSPDYTEMSTFPSYPPPYTAVQPPVSETPEPVTESQPAGLDPVELVRNPGDVPGLRSVPEGKMREEGDFRVSGQGGTVISVKKPSAAAVPNAAPAGKAVASVPAAPVVSRPAPRVASAAIPRPVNVPKAAIETKVHDDYWVQTGAFSTITKAEGVKESLSSRGITSIIENREVEGKTLFRVRVGPYTSQNEAGYWLSLIKSIDGFEESQIRVNQSRR